MKLKNITFKPSALYTQAQNKAVERSGSIIMKKARAIQISTNLLYDMWKEIINTAIYLYNQISREVQDQKSLYKVFFSVIEEFKKRLMLVYLKVYNYRAYAIIEKVQDKMK